MKSDIDDLRNGALWTRSGASEIASTHNSYSMPSGQASVPRKTTYKLRGKSAKVSHRGRRRASTGLEKYVRWFSNEPSQSAPVTGGCNEIGMQVCSSEEQSENCGGPAGGDNADCGSS